MAILSHMSKKLQAPKGERLLIVVNVLGSAGPLRFLVNKEELVAAVIATALKFYAREGRLPVLRSDLNCFHLYPANAGSDALSPWETIGSGGGRTFLLCKKLQAQQMEEGAAGVVIGRKGSRNWTAWLNKSLNFKIKPNFKIKKG